jgi:hypothetical protein
MRTLLATSLLLGLASWAFAGSDTPPEGPSWERNLLEAQTKALERGVPLFVYFTKTY